LILLEFSDFSALRIGNTCGNTEANPSASAPAAVMDSGARMRNGAAGGRRCARAPHRLITMSKSRSSVAGSSEALNALFRAKQSLDAGENLLFGVPRFGD